VRKAETDFRAAQKLDPETAELADQVCFLCQQSVEKYLKALLQEQGISFPRTHDLEALRALLVPDQVSLRRFRRGLEFLTRFAVETRYPGESATKRQAVASFRWAAKLRTACRELLGIRES
jgi:HEPN domain-containing protein